jgi:tetratricopeptide (TPR) repeat protein
MTEQATQQDAARRAAELFQRGFPRAAIDVLEAELARQPEEGALWRLRAVLLQREGRQAEAFDNIQRALPLVPLGYEGLLVLAAGYVRHGHRASAASLLSDLAADAEFPAELWEPLYNGFCSLERWQAALAVCRRAARLRPDDDAICFAAANTLARLGRPPQLSLAMLRRAIGLNPSEPRYRVSLAMHLAKMGQVDDAYRTFTELSRAEVEGISCRCCLHKALQLCIERGDVIRSSWLAGRLAAISLTRRQSSCPPTSADSPSSDQEDQQ